MEFHEQATPRSNPSTKDVSERSDLLQQEEVLRKLPPLSLRKNVTRSLAEPVKTIRLPGLSNHHLSITSNNYYPFRNHMVRR